MRIAIGSDHAGFQLKEKVAGWLRDLGLQVEDLGTDSEDRCDYPDYARAVAERVALGGADRGILVCGSGIGMAMAANKVAGIRAAACCDPVSAQLSRAHNDANVLCMGARLVSEESARKMVEVWLRTPFEAGRHTGRMEKIRELERQYMKSPPK
jgi:ribose 5-phosphate isomerase B